MLRIIRLGIKIFRFLLQNKVEEFERVRSRLESDMAEIRGRQSREEAELHRELRQSEEAIGRLTRELDAANAAANDFRQEVAQLSSELAAASEQKVRMMTEADRKLRDFEREKVTIFSVLLQKILARVV